MRTKWIFLSIRSRISFALSGALLWGCVTGGLTGCQQAGGPAGAGGLAPIGTLPQGQSPMNSSFVPSIGPFGASARVPPPPTGSFGNDGTGGTATSSYGPAGSFNSSAGNVIPMGHTATDSLGSGVNQAGGAFAGVAASPGNNSNDQWVETNAVAAPNFPPGSFASPSQTRSALRGGMPVSDLTGAPTPPGYQPGQFQSNGMQQQSGVPIAALPGQLPATQLAPSTSFTGPTASFGSGMSPPNTNAANLNQSPAANQPSLPGADRSIQWRSPNRY